MSCGQKIDGSTEETYKESLESLKKSLSPEEVVKLEEALKNIAFQNIESFADLSDVDRILEDAREKLDGMTYEEIVDEGKRVQEIIDERNKEQARLEIEELYAKKENSTKDSIQLAKFKIEKSRFYKRKSGIYYITYDPIIDITVFNGTEEAISRAYFKGVLKSPERTIPWIVEEFNYQIPGGLEPNEKVNWKLEPNILSNLGEVDAPGDAVFTVTVTKLDGADGETLFSIDFDDNDKERLEELLKGYPEFRKKF